MTQLKPDLLYVQIIDGTNETSPLNPRTYTLTHSDSTGELFLTIGKEFNLPQIKGIYSRLMRDEVLAKWELSDHTILHAFCHVSGGLVFGTARMRYDIFRYHMPMVLEAFYYGDRILLKEHPALAKGSIGVHYRARQNRFNRDETWGVFEDYHVE